MEPLKSAEQVIADVIKKIQSMSNHLEHEADEWAEEILSALTTAGSGAQPKEAETPPAMTWTKEKPTASGAYIESPIVLGSRYYSVRFVEKREGEFVDQFGNSIAGDGRLWTGPLPIAPPGEAPRGSGQ